MHDAMHAASLDSHAGSYGVDAVVEALNGNLGALAGHAGNLLDDNQTIGYLGHLGLEQSLQELGAGTAQDDLGVVVVIGHALYHGTNGLALAVHIGGYLLCLGQDELVVLVIDKKYLTLPYLVYFGRDNLALAVLIFIIERVVLQLQYLGRQGLAEGKDGAAAKLGKVHALRNVLAHLVVGLNLAGVGQADFLILVLHLTVVNDHAVAIDFEVALVGVDNHVEVLIAAVNLGQHVAEALFKHAHQCGAVYVLSILKLLEGINHTDCHLVCFLCCHSLFETY